MVSILIHCLLYYVWFVCSCWYAIAILRLLVYARNWTLTITIAECDTYAIWREYQEEQEEGMCVEDWLEDDYTGLYDVKLVKAVMEELRDLREKRDLDKLEFALAPLFHRYTLRVDEWVHIAFLSFCPLRDIIVVRPLARE